MFFLGQKSKVRDAWRGECGQRGTAFAEVRLFLEGFGNQKTVVGTRERWTLVTLGRGRMKHDGGIEGVGCF